MQLEGAYEKRGYQKTVIEISFWIAPVDEFYKEERMVDDHVGDAGNVSLCCPYCLACRGDD